MYLGKSHHTTFESDAGEDLQTESADDEHIPEDAQCEIERAGDGTSDSSDETGYTTVIAADATELRESREVVKSMVDIDIDRIGLDEFHQPPNDPHNTARVLVHVHVDPGGSTATDRTERAACGSESG